MQDGPTHKNSSTLLATPSPSSRPKINQFIRMSDDEVQLIFLFLPCDSLLNVMLTCKFFWRLMDNAYWEKRHPFAKKIQSKLHHQNQIIDWKLMYQEYLARRLEIMYLDGLDYVFLSNHGYTVTNTGRYNRFPVRLKAPVPDDGIFIVSVRVLSIGTPSWTGIGVVSHKILGDITECFCKNDCVGRYSNSIFNVGYFDNGFMCRCMVGFNTEGFTATDIISVRMDMDKGSMCFLKNGKQIGPDFGEIKKDGDLYIILNLSARNLKTNTPTVLELVDVSFIPKPS